MKQFIQRFGNFAAWSSAGVLVLGIAALELMRKMRPEWFCQAVDLGGKEFVCGSGYLILPVEVFARVFLVALLGLYFLGLAALFGKNVTRGGLVSLCLVTMVLFAGLVLKYYLALSDSP